MLFSTIYFEEVVEFEVESSLYKNNIEIEERKKKKLKKETYWGNYNKEYLVFYLR